MFPELKRQKRQTSFCQAQSHDSSLMPASEFAQKEVGVVAGFADVVKKVVPPSSLALSIKKSPKPSSRWGMLAETVTS